MSARIAIDTGGTFTDVVTLSDGRLSFDKVATTPDQPERGVLAGLLMGAPDPAELDTFIHGTTLGLNALLTRTGGRTGIITTRGFRDVYLLGRTDRVPMYDTRYRKPTSLVQRRDILEVTERCTFDGQVLTPFDDADAYAAAHRVEELGLEAVTVSFLHAYANPVHEQRMREILAEVAPDVEVTLCSDLSRELREYERTSTGVLDAYIKPVVRSYLSRLEGAVAERDFDGQFLMTRSGGGAMTVGAARQAPVNLILSGPAGGVLGAAWLAEATGHRDLVTIDMGGTSLDASLIIDGAPMTHFDAQFEGLPINVASLYIHTIGAGGGSLVWVDDGGHLQVGPASAGAVPGPAAYGQGGTQATFTDAALHVGYLGDDVALAGSLVLDAERAAEALRDPAERLGVDLDTVAGGVLRISTTKIVGAVRAITVELGHDPADLAMLAFGGAGGLVAVDVARELSIGTVIVPPGPGAFCAFGMLHAEVRHDLSRTRIGPLDALDVADVQAELDEMHAEGDMALDSDGFAPHARSRLASIDLRYVGQEHSVRLDLGPVFDEGEVARLREAFGAAHEQAYGHVMPDPIEVVALRTSAIGRHDPPVVPTQPRRDGHEVSPHASRTVLAPSGEREQYAVYLRDDLAHGDTLTGPAVIAEHTGTTVMHAGDTAEVGAHAEIVITLGKDS